MRKRTFLKTGVFLAAGSTSLRGGAQARALRVGLVLPMTGPFAALGRQMEAGARLYVSRNGDMVAGRRIEFIVRDDTGSAELAKRLSQELVVNDDAEVIAGF